MSSYTASEFIAELKNNNAVIAAHTDAKVLGFLNTALRKISGVFPELRISADNEVVTDQELYDFPADALSITKIIDSDSRKEIAFTIENQGGDDPADQIRLGNIVRSSASDLLEATYYDNPLAQVGSSQVTGYTSFDIEYSLLQTIETIKDTSLDAISFYVEYLACNNKASEVAAGAVSSSERVAESISDTDSSGASTQIQYSSTKDTTTVLRTQANEALERFNAEIGRSAYGVRG